MSDTPISSATRTGLKPLITKEQVLKRFEEDNLLINEIIDLINDRLGDQDYLRRNKCLINAEPGKIFWSLNLSGYHQLTPVDLDVLIDHLKGAGWDAGVFKNETDDRYKTLRIYVPDELS